MRQARAISEPDRPESDRPLTDPRFGGLSHLERLLVDHAAATDKRIADLSEIVDALRQILQQDDRAEMRAELLWRERRLAEAEATAQQQITELSQALSAIRGSVAWRVTGPLRWLAAKLTPEQRGALRRLARRTYWLLTPQRMAMRRQWVVFAPQNEETSRRLLALSLDTRSRLPPSRRSYGETAVEQLDIYRTVVPDAPIFVLIHGGGWRTGQAVEAGFAAETFVNAGAHYVVPDFVAGHGAGGDVRIMVEQVRRAIAWVYRNAASFGGDPQRLFVGGHSCGGHLCAAALVSDWAGDFGLPSDFIRGGLLMSGIYDLRSVRTARHSPHLIITDEIEAAMSPRRHVERLPAPLIITCGGAEAPEFRKQSHDLFAAAAAAGKPAELIEAPHFGHLEMAESLGGPYGPNGRAALRLMGLAP